MSGYCVRCKRTSQTMVWVGESITAFAVCPECADELRKKWAEE